MAAILLALEVPREVLKTFYTPLHANFSILASLLTQQCLQISPPSSPSVVKKSKRRSKTPKNENEDLETRKRYFRFLGNHRAKMNFEPVHTYPCSFENAMSFCFQKNSRPHVAFSHRFRPSTRIR